MGGGEKCGLAEADRIAGQHGARDIAASFNAQTEPVLQIANSVLHGPLVRGLLVEGSLPRRLRCSTSSDFLHLAAAAEAETAGSSVPPAPRHGTSAIVWLPAAEVELSKLIAAAGTFIGRDSAQLLAEFGIGQLPPSGGRERGMAFSAAAPPAMSVSVEFDHEWLALTMRPRRVADGVADGGRGGQ